MGEKINDGLYIVIPTLVLRDERLSKAAVLLYGIIGGLSNATGYCFASNAYLSQLLNVNDRSIRRLLGELVKCEYIAVEVERTERNEVKERRIVVRSHLTNIQPKEAKKPSGKAEKLQEPRKAYGTMQNVLLTDKQYSELMARYPNIDEEIETMSLYLSAKGQTYKNYYAALLNWMRRKQASESTANERKGSKWDGVDY